MIWKMECFENLWQIATIAEDAKLTGRSVTAEMYYSSSFELPIRSTMGNYKNSKEFEAILCLWMLLYQKLKDDERLNRNRYK